MDSVNVRNLEQIQEDNVRPAAPRLGTWLLASVAGAALIVAAGMASKRSGPPARSDKDPLAALAVQAKLDAKESPQKLSQREVSFPAVLSDQTSSTTALAAVRDERGRLIKQDGAEAAGLGSAAPPIGSAPLGPLSVGALLGATAVTRQPKDQLTQLVVGGASPESPTDAVPAGTDGGYQLQVASFKAQTDADSLVNDLRKRGHRAFRQAAYVPGRGLWHRVRIGPFRSGFEAQQYKKKFEQAEHLSPFLVDPVKVEQAEELRAAKVEARTKKKP